MALLGPEARGCSSGCGRVWVVQGRSAAQTADSYPGFAIVGALGLWIRRFANMAWAAITDGQSD